MNMRLNGKWRGALGKSLSLGGWLLCTACVALGQTPIVLDPPAGTVDGVNVINASTVIVQLRAPGKDYVHLRGDFNNFTSTNGSLMRKSVDGTNAE